MALCVCVGMLDPWDDLLRVRLTVSVRELLLSPLNLPVQSRHQTKRKPLEVLQEEGLSANVSTAGCHSGSVLITSMFPLS